MQCKKAHDQKLARNVICATVILNFSNYIVLDDSQRERHIEHQSWNNLFLLKFIRKIINAYKRKSISKIQIFEIFINLLE